MHSSTLLVLEKDITYINKDEEPKPWKDQGTWFHVIATGFVLLVLPELFHVAL